MQQPCRAEPAVEGQGGLTFTGSEGIKGATGTCITFFLAVVLLENQLRIKFFTV